jgi:hypothetical protein
MPDPGEVALQRLRAAKTALETYAAGDNEKKLFAAEVDDIMRRIAADLESAKKA